MLEKQMNIEQVQYGQDYVYTKVYSAKDQNINFFHCKLKKTQNLHDLVNKNEYILDIDD